MSKFFGPIAGESFEGILVLCLEFIMKQNFVENFLGGTLRVISKNNKQCHKGNNCKDTDNRHQKYLTNDNEQQKK